MLLQPGREPGGTRSAGADISLTSSFSCGELARLRPPGRGVSSAAVLLAAAGMSPAAEVRVPDERAVVVAVERPVLARQVVAERRVRGPQWLQYVRVDVQAGLAAARAEHPVD